MNSNDKGLLGELKIATDLILNGYEVFSPIGDYSSIDLIALKDNEIKKIQIKWRKLNKVGVITTPLYSVINGKKILYDLNLIDIFAIYNPDTDRIIYLNTKEILDFKTIRLIKSKAHNARSIISLVYSDIERAWNL